MKSPPSPDTRVERRGIAWRVYLGPLLWLLLGLSLAYWAAVADARDERARAREAVRLELEPIAGALSRELFGAIGLTQGIAGLITVEGGMTEAKFLAFASELFRRTDLIRNVAVAPDNVVAFVYPLQGNESTIGLDYSKQPDQWPSVARMMQEQRGVVAGPVKLVQGGVGVIGRTPIYVVDTLDGRLRPRRYWGLTSTVLEFDKLLARTRLHSASDRLSIALRGTDGAGASGAPFFGDAAVFDKAPVTLDVPLPEGSWQLAALPRGGWPPFRLFGSTSFWVGALLSAALSALMLRLLQTGQARQQEVEHRRRAEAALTASNRQLASARDDLEERVGERTRELRMARDAAESADKLKSAFLATMSHELRTPLNSIIGFSGLLAQGLAGPLNEEQAKQMRMVRGSASHLLSLINDVLDLSKIEAGQLRLRAQPFDLRELLEKTAATVRPQVEAKGLELRLEISPEISTMVSDARRVQQVLLNLLSNGVKFTEQGHIQVQAERVDARIVIRVCDTGVGIKDEDLPKLFKPFSQVETGLNRRYDGTGLGLSICRRLVDHLGGEIRVDSEWGKGSCFIVELPVGEGEGVTMADFGASA